MGHHNTAIINFENGTIDSFPRLKTTLFFISSTSVSDKEGNLQFFSDGVYVKNKNADIIQDGDKFALGHFDSAYYFPGTPYIQGVLLLPMPESDSLYYFFHQASVDSVLPQANRLFYSIIDASINGGTGAVINRNNILLDTFITDAGMGLCKHANGRDWWLIKPKYKSNIYYKFLVKSSGIIEGPFKQSIGVASVEPDWKGQVVFTVSGNKMACTHELSKGQLFDFDRCTGLLSNPQNFYDSSSTYLWGGGGLSFSPSGRFMYMLGDSFQLEQFDTYAQDLNASKIVIIRTPANEPDKLFYHQLGPDGKIYIEGHNSPSFMSVINFPDSLGFACGIDTFSFQIFPQGNTFGMPCFPHYRTPTCAAYAADAGRDTTVCDSLLNLSVGITLGKPAVDSVVYSWSSPNDLSFGGSTQPQIIVHPAQTATYILHIQDTCTHPTYSCTERWDTVVVTVTGSCITAIDNGRQTTDNGKMQIQVYPNPASDFVNVVIDKTMLGSELKITDVTGRVVMAVQLQTTNYKLETTRFERGVYFIEVKTRGSEWKQKLVLDYV